MENIDITMENADMEVDDMYVESSKASLLRLDDLVLSTVMAYLSVDDVSNLAATCVRLQDLATKHTELHHRSVSWQKDEFKHDYVASTSSKRVWSHCGKHVRSVTLSNWNGNELIELLTILSSYCINLEVLTFNGITGMKSTFKYYDPQIFRMFSKLKKFQLISCIWSRWCPLHRFFGEANSNLEELAIINCFKTKGERYSLSFRGFNALKKVDLMHCKNILSDLELEECFQQNPITSLTVTDVNKINLYSFDLIDALVNTLETLTIDYFIFNLDQVLKLKKLKSLSLNCRNHTNVDQLLQKFRTNNVVEELVFTRIIISEKTMQALGNFNRLTSLRFNHCQNTIDYRFFKSLPSVCPQLQQFVYAHNNIVDKSILHVVKSMPKLKRLSLFDCNPLKTVTYFEIEKIVNSDWCRPKLEMIPPNFSSLKELKDIESIRKNILLRTDIYDRFYGGPITNQY